MGEFLPNVEASISTGVGLEVGEWSSALSTIRSIEPFRALTLICPALELVDPGMSPSVTESTPY